MRLGFAPSNVVNIADHPLFGRVRYSAMDLGNWPDEQVARTIGVMQVRTSEDMQDPGFKARAQGIADPALSDFDKIANAYAHTKGALQFQRDEATGAGVGDIPPEQVIEVIIRPTDMAQYVDQGIGTGDCDDFSMYLAAILEAVDVPCAFVTVAADGKAPDQYSHVYVAAYPRDENGNRVRVPLDASHGQYPGWEVPNQYGKLREWPVRGNGFGALVLASALGGLLAMWAWRNREAFA